MSLAEAARVLGLDDWPDTQEAELRRRYKRLCLAWHPDKQAAARACSSGSGSGSSSSGPGAPAATRAAGGVECPDASGKRFKRLQAAYELLAEELQLRRRFPHHHGSATTTAAAGGSQRHGSRAGGGAGRWQDAEGGAGERVDGAAELYDILAAAFSGADEDEVEARLRAAGAFRPPPGFGIDPRVRWAPPPRTPRRAG